MIISLRPHWWDGSLWWRTYREGGFDGWRTIGRRRMPCDTMFAALTIPHLHGEISRMTRQQPRQAAR
jgi:hypothetical protein